MPSVWSKILMPEWSFPYNCYEVGHTWTPSCSEAALEIGFIILRESIKLYTPLYLLSQGLQKKYNANAFYQTLHSIARSSIFLSFNGFSVILIFCLLRRLMGKFYYTMCAYTPAFVGSLLAIMIERPSRRPALAVYVTNIATETLYRIFVSRGYFSPIPRGEVILFTVTMSVLMYLVKRNGYGTDPVSLALKFIVGKEEAKKRIRSEVSRNNETNDIHLQSPYPSQSSKSSTSSLSSSYLNLIFKLFEKFNSLFPKHKCCPHIGKSCPVYVMGAFIRPFFIGCIGQALLKSFSKPKLFLNRPSILRDNLMNPRNMYFGLFLGGFTSIFKGINCALRWACNESHDWHGFVGGLFGGPAMLFSPNSSITLYLMWKCIESLYCIGVKNGYIPFVNHTVHILYALSTAQLFYAAVLEPKHMKPSYMKFLDRMTDHRLHLLNRMVLDVFGTDASAGYESYFPDLDMKYMTKRFQESVLMWLL